MILHADTQLHLTPLALKRARERAGLSQEELASRSRISVPPIQSYECRGHRPQYSYLLMLLEVYGMDLGGFYSLLTDIYVEQWRGGMEERVDHAERQVKALEDALAKVDESCKGGQSTRTQGCGMQTASI